VSVDWIVVLQDVSLCSIVDSYHSLGGTCCLHLRGINPEDHDQERKIYCGS
jgi:hypothetical protein